MDTKKYLSCVFSGFTSAFLFHPIDSLRTRLLFGNKVFTMRALYNGFCFGALANIAKNAVTYPTQEFIKGNLGGLGLTQRETVSGLLSGILLGFFSTPVNAIKVPLFSSSSSTLGSVTKQIYATYGLKGFYRGCMGTIMRDAVWNMLYFPLFANINKKFDNRFLSAVLASMISLFFTYPFDGIRMFRQNNKANYNFWYGFKYAFNTSPANLKSFGVCMIRVPLSVSLSHYIYLISNDILIKK